MDFKEIIEKYTDSISAYGNVADIIGVHKELELADNQICISTNVGENAVNSIVEILPLLKKHDLKMPFMVNNKNDSIQIYALKFDGTNGKENTIINSLDRVNAILKDIQSDEHINWVTLSDVKIDILDDSYIFAITFILK